MKLLVVDDHAVVREGVRRLLMLMPDTTVVEAGTQAEALELFQNEKPDVVILDINLDGASGLDLLQRFQRDRDARVIIFSMHAEPAYAMRAIRAGALGYVSKSAAAGELIEAVKHVAQGKSFLDRKLANQLALNPGAATDPLQRLTNREAEILRLLGEGKSLSEIAGAFGIAYKTVANTCTRLKEKLGVERTADLIRISIEQIRPRPHS